MGLIEAHHTPYPDVRALDRGLILIEALAEFGWAGPSELAKITGIDRSTIYRLLSTLMRRGFILHRKQDSKYFLSPSFKALSYGVQDFDERMLLVSGPLRNLVEEIKWPSDFAVLKAGRLVIIDSNHPQTTLTFYRSVLGQARPILRSSLGRAMLAAMSGQQRREAIETIIASGGADADEVRDEKIVTRVVEDTRERGYALSIGELTPKIAAIALPVRSREMVLGAVNIVFFSAAFKPEAVETYLAALRQCVERIEQAFQGMNEPVPRTG